MSDTTIQYNIKTHFLSDFKTRSFRCNQYIQYFSFRFTRMIINNNLYFTHRTSFYISRNNHSLYQVIFCNIILIAKRNSFTKFKLCTFNLNIVNTSIIRHFSLNIHGFTRQPFKFLAKKLNHGRLSIISIFIVISARNGEENKQRYKQRN